MLQKLTEPVDVRILSAGRNWMAISSLLAVGLNGYYSKLPAGSTIAAITTDPGKASMDGPQMVVEGRYHMGITTPTWLLSMARQGKGYFTRPLPVCTIAVFPHDDRLALAVRKETGVTSLKQIKDRQLPLKISMPARELSHNAGWVVDQVFELYGFSREDVESWGGELLKDRPRSQNSAASAPVDPSFDALFDEAIMTLRWQRVTSEYDMRFLPIEDEQLAACVEMGMDAAVLEQGRLRGLEADVPTIDFSGWVLYCTEDLPYELGYLTAGAIDELKDEIKGRFTGATAAMTSPIDMHRVGRDVPAPLHPGAEAYYREHGYV